MTNHHHRSIDTDPSTGEIDVFVVDDHQGYRALVAEVVAATNGFTVRGSAASWADAIVQFEASCSQPDLVFMDINLGERSGVDAARELKDRWPETKVILISTIAEDDLPVEARTSGASGFLPKSQLGPTQVAQAWLGAYDWPQ